MLVLPLSTVGAHTHTSSNLAAVVLLSLASAAAYGIGAVLQHRAATREPADLSMRPGLLINLARHPVWILANGLDVVGYVLQFLALRSGSLSLVEPLLVLSLVFALPVAARLDHRPISLVEVLSAGVVGAGLAIFLVVGRPGPGQPDTTAAAWLTLTIVVAAFCSAMALGARSRSPRSAALLLGTGSGCAFGYVAAATTWAGHLLDGGIVHLLTTLAPYTLAAGGAAALLLTQSAFHAGPLRLSLPTLTVVQPLVAVAIGVGLFGEHINTNGLAPLMEVAGLGLVTVGVFTLARSPTITLEDGTRALPEP
jgi:drug/metabolite transporter (DMT)-like permease